jgi:hypothetical protein
MMMGTPLNSVHAYLGHVLNVAYIETVLVA